jgi:ABC-type transport system involved in multi-copper enzyme maturation permease subunit
MSTWIAIMAILRESWLTLRAEKLFKLVLGLNLIVIVAYMSVGFDDAGISIFFGLTHVDSEYIRSGTPFARTLYLGIYSAFIVNIWLAWAASILALISTSSIFPSFLKEGAVELVMSRPTQRTTIFCVKYIGGLLFVAVQVGIFTLGAFFAAGWRIDVWDPAIFLAIPLVTLFYSYLFCVNILGHHHTLHPDSITRDAAILVCDFQYSRD